MAIYLPLDAPVKNNIPTPLTLTALQTYVGGFVKFIELNSGDILVVNDKATEFASINHHANSFARSAGPIYGHAVLCSPSEIA